MAVVKKVIKLLEKDFGGEKGNECVGFEMDCPVCRTAMVTSQLRNYLDLLKWDVEQN